MIHARTDYDRIQDPALHDASLLSEGSTPFGEDEPVFLIRAKDMCGAAAVMAWADENDRMGGDPAISAHVRRWAEKMTAWRVREADGGKMPSAPRSVLRAD